MAVQWCENKDPRINTLRKGFNQRWPTAGNEAQAIAICRTSQDVADALNETVRNRKVRPTIRSGGHCYEGFVSNNANGVIIDVSQLDYAQTNSDPTLKYQIGSGVQNWNAYVTMYKLWGTTLPGGSCYTVGVGGHVSGGGFGYMSRLHGLTVDWLSAVKIVTMDSGKGKPAKEYLVSAKSTDPDEKALFRALRGAGNGNFGVITDYYFSDLPVPPTEALLTVMHFNWSDFDQSNLKKFEDLLNTYADYWAGRGQNPETYGMFGSMKLTHVSNGSFFIRIQTCSTQPAGRITAKELALTQEFIDLFAKFNPQVMALPGAVFVDEPSLPWTGEGRLTTRDGQTVPKYTVLYDWLNAVQALNGATPNQRGKYKSAYMKKRFTARESMTLHKYLHLQPTGGISLASSLVQIDTYGGNINKADLIQTTSASQRASIMKLQYQAYWTNPDQDQEYQDWINLFYKDMYWDDSVVPREFRGTPYPGANYEGCYIGYPDVEMANVKDNNSRHFWPDLYYPAIYSDLQKVKRRFDPDNIFNYALSVKT
ncbi:FAD linked oxidase domain-containing protein [Pandoraea horticolens]|uniref:FAD linked oxidase domain-containing protein n=1 Tax=Pandoraea horticolens TaxID=2508298 RepID=A0A5E4X9J8_9BURK|nr:FAD-binding protein [Pandoraea horticolens]VVE33049.1 FAD linked oxidase domain-containing protein [Pandoraea horticolens]